MAVRILDVISTCSVWLEPVSTSPVGEKDIHVASGNVDAKPGLCHQQLLFISSGASGDCAAIRWSCEMKSCEKVCSIWT